MTTSHTSTPAIGLPAEAQEQLAGLPPEQSDLAYAQWHSAAMGMRLASCEQHGVESLLDDLRPHYDAAQASGVPGAQGNAWYWWGVAHSMLDDDESAAHAFRQAMQVTNTDVVYVKAWHGLLDTDPEAGCAVVEEASTRLADGDHTVQAAQHALVTRCLVLRSLEDPSQLDSVEDHLIQACAHAAESGEASAFEQVDQALITVLMGYPVDSLSEPFWGALDHVCAVARTAEEGEWGRWFAALATDLLGMSGQRDKATARAHEALTWPVLDHSRDLAARMKLRHSCALIAMDAEDYDSAAEHAAASVEEDPTLASMHALLAQCRTAQDQHRQAHTHWERAFELYQAEGDYEEQFELLPIWSQSLTLHASPEAAHRLCERYEPILDALRGVVPEEELSFYQGEVSMYRTAVYAAEGNLEQSLAHLHQSRQFYANAGHDQRVVVTYFQEVQICLLTQRGEEATAMAQTVHDMTASDPQLNAYVHAEIREIFEASDALQHLPPSWSSS